jgi:hypothetical protein
MNKTIAVLLSIITITGCVPHDEGVPRPPVQNSVLRMDSIGGCQYVFIYDSDGVAITHHGGCLNRKHDYQGSYGGWDIYNPNILHHSFDSAGSVYLEK